MTDTAKALDLHISIARTDPQIWRDLRVPAENPLGDLHAAIQRAFGWQDYHLHMFTAMDENGNRRLFTAGEESAAELGAGLDTDTSIGDVLVQTGDKLEYEYDFGDGWEHEINVTGHALAPVGAFSCLDGANRGPVEDSGGIGGYHQLCAILADEQDPEYGEMAGWYSSVTGQPASKFDPGAFDLESVNAQLSRLSVLIAGEPPTRDEMAEVVRPVKWLLQQAGTDGLDLTKDGYLKPAMVAETMAGLGWGKRWYGKFNRETQTLPVWELRTKMQEWKLLRKYKGKLLRTPAARKMYDDDAALWDYLAGKVAPQSQSAVDDAKRLMVDWLLEDRMPPWNAVGDAVAQILTGEGFRAQDGSAVAEAAGSQLYHDVRRELETLGIFEPERELLSPRALSAGGIKFLQEVRLRY